MEALVLVLCILFTLIPVQPVSAASAELKTVSNSGSADSLVEENYATVSKQWANKGLNIIRDKEYIVQVTDHTTTGKVVASADAYKYGKDVLELQTGDTIEFVLDVEKAGLYALAIDYYCLSEKAVNHTISVKVDDTYQFSEARELVLTQYYECEKYPFRIDTSGHEITPDSYIRYGWENQVLRGINQSATDALYFNLKAGTNKITITVVIYIKYTLGLKIPKVNISFNDAFFSRLFTVLNSSYFFSS